MIRTIRFDVAFEVDGDWPGDDAATEAALAAFGLGVVCVSDNCALLPRSTTAHVLSAEEPQP